MKMAGSGAASGELSDVDRLREELRQAKVKAAGLSAPTEKSAAAHNLQQ